MNFSMFVLSAALALTACKKKEQPAPTAGSAETAGSAMAAGPSATDTGSAIAGSAATPAPAGSAGSDVVLVDAGAAAPTGSAAGSAAGSNTGSTGARPDCVLYAKVSKSCTHGLKDEATIADECERALTKNTAMAGSINIQIACAKADPACGPFYKCIAKH